MTAPLFVYSDEVASRFPGVNAAVIRVTDFHNDEQPADLASDYLAIQAQELPSLAETTPGERPSVEAWRRIFSAMGVKPTRHRNAAEALLRRLLRDGELPSINSAVDVGNAVSIRHSLPVAVFDLDAVASPIRVEFAQGDEIFTGIGSSVEHPSSGEVIFIDADGRVLARRWCWKQSVAAATQPNTTNALFVIEAAHEGAAAATVEAADDLEAMVRRYFPAATTTSATSKTS